MTLVGGASAYRSPIKVQFTIDRLLSGLAETAILHFTIDWGVSSCRLLLVLLVSLQIEPHCMVALHNIPTANKSKVYRYVNGLYSWILHSTPKVTVMKRFKILGRTTHSSLLIYQTPEFKTNSKNLKFIPISKKRWTDSR